MCGRLLIVKLFWIPVKAIFSFNEIFYISLINPLFWKTAGTAKISVYQNRCFPIGSRNSIIRFIILGKIPISLDFYNIWWLTFWAFFRVFHIETFLLSGTWPLFYAQLYYLSYLLFIILLNLSISPAQSHSVIQLRFLSRDVPHSIHTEKPLHSSWTRWTDTQEPQKSGGEAHGQFSPPVWI